MGLAERGLPQSQAGAACNAARSAACELRRANRRAYRCIASDHRKATVDSHGLRCLSAPPYSVARQCRRKAIGRFKPTMAPLTAGPLTPELRAHAANRRLSHGIVAQPATACKPGSTPNGRNRSFRLLTPVTRFGWLTTVPGGTELTDDRRQPKPPRRLALVPSLHKEHRP